MKSHLFPVLIAGLLTVCPVTAEQKRETVRVGSLAFGTLNWELKLMSDASLDRSRNIAVETTSLAGAEAGKIALLGGSVDLIVADWIWAAGQREQGSDLIFLPYSSNHGALVVAANSPIKSIGDLKGKRLGVVGGGLDKNWLILRAVAQKTIGLDLDKNVEKIFGAPPLLNQQLQQGKLDAVLNYWNHAAKLEAQGFRQIIDGREMLRELGIQSEVPALGYVFHAAWAKAHGATLNAFLEGTRQARSELCAKDEPWAKVAPLLEEPDEKVRAALRQRYCEGHAGSFGTAEKQAAQQVYNLLHDLSGGQIGGKSGKLPEGLFWNAGE